MSTISVQKVSETPLEATYSNADTVNGDKCVNKSGDVFLHLKNGGASEADVTVAAQVSSKDIPGYGPMSKSNLVVNIPAGEERFIGPFPSSAWSDSDGFLNWDYSGVGEADVDVAALRLA